jgi:hypothetical protein
MKYMIKNIIIGFLTILCALAFTFAAYQKSEAEKQIEIAETQTQLADELRFQLVKMRSEFDSLNSQMNSKIESIKF